MKKFAETVIKNGGGCFEVYKNGKTTYEIQGLTSSPLIIFGDWVSPEDHQNTVASNKAYEKSNRTLSEENAKFVVENIELQKQIAELKSQLEKQQPEIPEVPPFVAELIKKRKGNWSLFGAFRNISGNKYDNEKLYEWVFAHAGRQEIFAQAWLNGYTVAKEKRFYLKAKELLVVGDYDHVEDLWLDFNKNYTPKKSMAYKFTQKEIDSMETGSYEQIEVEE